MNLSFKLFTKLPIFTATVHQDYCNIDVYWGRKITLIFHKRRKNVLLYTQMQHKYFLINIYLQ